MDSLLITNVCGAHATLESSTQLEHMIEGRWNLVPTNKIDELFAKNFISEGSDRLSRANLLATGLATAISAATAGPSLFMVVPTLRCDHSCNYCQVSRVPVSKAGYDLGATSIDKILTIIQHSRRQFLKIEFQGGEPLLQFDYIQEFVKKAKIRLNDRSVSFVICSALGPLNDRILQWAKSEDIEFSVSLDGPASVHNANRPSKYFEAHENTICGIQRIQRQLGPNKIGCLATVTRDTLVDPTALVDSYFDLDLESIYIRPLSPFGFAAPSSLKISYTADEYFSFYRNCLNRILELNSKRLFIEESANVLVNRILRPGHTSNVDMQSPAGHTFGALVFNYDGNVFGSDESRMLWQSTKVPELVLAHINEGPSDVFLRRNSKNMLKDTFLFSTPGCDDCAYQPFCGSDPLHHLATQGDHVGDKSISFYCQLQRRMFDHMFTLLSSNSTQSKVLRSWLNR